MKWRIIWEYNFYVFYILFDLYDFYILIVVENEKNILICIVKLIGFFWFENILVFDEWIILVCLEINV